MVTSHNSSTLLTCRVSWKGNYITKIYDVCNLFSHAKKVVHEGAEGSILKDILHWLLIKQKVLSWHAQQKVVPFLLWYVKKYLWLLDRDSSFDDWFSVYLFHGKIIAFVIFTLLIFCGPTTDVAIILMPQLRQDTVFTLLASHLQLLRKILLTDAQNHCVYNRAKFKISALL